MQARVPREIPRHPIWLLTAFWISVAIALAVVIRRVAALLRVSSARGDLAALDSSFAAHSPLTFAHISVAAIFVLLATATLFRVKQPDWLSRSLFVFGGLTGATAYAMNVIAIGGWVERSAVIVFNTWFLISLGMACGSFLSGHHSSQREWTVRAVGVLLGIATTRPVIGVFFATRTLSHLTPQQFFGLAFWIGFSLNTVAVECWLRSHQRSLLARPA